MGDKEIELKVEQIARHKVNGHLTNLWFDISEFKWYQKLMEQKFIYIEKDMGEIKSLLTEFIKKVEDKYATKDDVEKKYESHANKFRMINKFFFIVFSTIVTAIVVAISQAL